MPDPAAEKANGTTHATEHATEQSNIEQSNIEQSYIEQSSIEQQRAVEPGAVRQSVVEQGAIKQSAIEATNLYRFFHSGGEETLALRGVSLSVRPGEIVAITGPSGSGKSTLLACLAGLDEPDGGMVRVSGEEMSRRPETERAGLRARSIGMLFQSNNLLNHLSLEANVAFARSMVKERDPNAPPLPPIATLLDELGLKARSQSRPTQLSGGEAARAGLAVALANEPSVIVADEPTGELDSQTAAMVLSLLKARASRGAAVILVTHSPAVAAVAVREIKLGDGVIVVEDAPTQIEAQGLKSRPTGERASNRPPGSNTVLVEMTDLGRTFIVGGQPIRALTAVSGRVLASEQIAIVGPSGSGKSTLLHLIAGIDQPSVGSISWPGLGDVANLRPGPIGVVFQSQSLLAPLTVLENVELPLVLKGEVPEVATNLAKEALDLLELSSLINKLPEELSGGQAQRVAIARVLAAQPRLILADEPTGQLDRESGAHVIDVLFAAAQASGAALIVNTHDPMIAARFANVWSMSDGVLTTDASQTELANNECFFDNSTFNTNIETNVNTNVNTAATAGSDGRSATTRQHNLKGIRS